MSGNTDSTREPIGEPRATRDVPPPSGARAMCLHSLEQARRLGYRGMQFNFVVSTNDRAVALWQSLGFETVGRLPKAFRHPWLGYVDALVMFRAL